MLLKNVLLQKTALNEEGGGGSCVDRSDGSKGGGSGDSVVSELKLRGNNQKRASKYRLLSEPYIPNLFCCLSFYKIIVRKLLFDAFSYMTCETLVLEATATYSIELGWSCFWYILFYKNIYSALV